MKKKAFTLTELLVVVVIIGVLSAVVLPKFNKVIESRRTAEAESVLRAVRNEQEMRCTLDKNYTTNKDNLAVWPKRDSANYTYALNSQGMSATSKDKDYTLEIKTYLDGGICCKGSYCNSLNKDYPNCDDYEATPNTKDCVPAGVEGEEEIEAEPTPISTCEPNNNGQASYTTECPSFQFGSQHYPQVGSVKYVWDYEECAYVEQSSQCVCAAPNGKSSYSENKCPSTQVGSYVYEWDTTSCSYIEHNYCSPKCETRFNEGYDKDQECTTGHGGLFPGGTWNEQTCDCECPEGTTLNREFYVCEPECDDGGAQSCEDPQRVAGYDTVAGTWDHNACTCKCPQGYKLDQYGQCYREVECDMGESENLYKAQDCESGSQYSEVHGTWNKQTCSCDCPPNTEWTTYTYSYDWAPYGACEPSCGPGFDSQKYWCTRKHTTAKDEVPGHWVGWKPNGRSCECVCLTDQGEHYGTYKRSDGTYGTYCYRQNCQTGKPRFGSWESDKSGCELSHPAWAARKCDNGGYNNSTSSDCRYFPGKWDDDNCQCNCPKGTRLLGGFCVLRRGVSPEDVDRDMFYGDDGYELEEGREWDWDAWLDDDGGDYDGNDQWDADWY